MNHLTILALLAILLVGCSSSTETAKNENAKSGTEATASNTAGNTTSGTPQTLTVTEEHLRAPFYPGATVDAGSAIHVKTDKEESVMVEMKSVDPIDKIKTFYEEKVPGLKFNSMNGKTQDHVLGQVKVQDGGTLAIQLKEDSGFVKIMAAYGKH